MSEIEIFGPIGEGLFDEGYTAKFMSRSMKEFNPEDDIVVRINSVGGDVYEGTTMYNMLKDHPGKVTVIVDGIAASMGSYIAMAGDEIQMYDNSLMMIHQPWTFAMGNADDMRATAEVLEKLAGISKKVYHKKSGLDMEKLDEIFASDTYLTAEEAKELGLVDTILEGNEGIEAKLEHAFSAKHLQKPEQKKEESTKDKVAARFAQLKASRLLGF